MKIELSLSPEYVIHWQLNEALRELFQNAIDNGLETMEFGYEPNKQRLSIISKNTFIDKSTLLLGKSDKKGKAIGKFGEGYKLALLVLTRLNKPVTIKTGSEIWRPRFGMNSVLKSKTLRVYIENRIFDVHTEIIIDGITAQEFNDYKKYNLHLSEYPEHCEGLKGNLLIGAGQKGNVYVNGLYITRLNGFEYGYDFKPEFIDLGRDRNIVSEFELQYSGIGIIEKYAQENPEEIIKKARSKKARHDFRYLENLQDKTKETLAEELLNESGEDAVFYSYSKPEDYEGTPVYVPDYLLKAVRSTDIYKNHLSRIPKIQKETVEDFLNSWLKYWKKRIPEDVQKSFKEQLIPRIKEAI